FCQSSVQELASIRLPQIQVGFPGIFLAGKEFLCVRKLSPKLGPDLLADRIATWPDARPDRCHHVYGLGSVLLLHPGNALLDNSRDGAPPSGVKRRHDSL